MRSYSVETEQSFLVQNIFALAAVPVICYQRYTNSVHCNMLSCTTDRVSRYVTPGCCTFNFEDQDINIVWDHLGQINDNSKWWEKPKIKTGVLYPIDKFHNLKTNLGNPTSVDTIVKYIRETALFHMRVGYNHRLAAQ